MEVWSAKRLNWSIVTRAHAPRQGGGDARPLRRTFWVLERARDSHELYGGAVLI
jgi:hypothetical protein